MIGIFLKHFRPYPRALLNSSLRRDPQSLQWVGLFFFPLGVKKDLIFILLIRSPSLSYSLHFSPGFDRGRGERPGSFLPPDIVFDRSANKSEGDSEDDRIDPGEARDRSELSEGKEVYRAIDASEEQYPYKEPDSGRGIHRTPRFSFVLGLPGVIWNHGVSLFPARSERRFDSCIFAYSMGLLRYELLIFRFW